MGGGGGVIARVRVFTPLRLWAMSKRPAESAETAPPTKRARTDNEARAVEALQAGLDTAVIATRNALTSMTAFSLEGKLVVPALRQLRRARTGDRITTCLEFVNVEFEFPDVLRMMEGRCFPLLSSAIAGGVMRRALYERAEEHWNLCTTLAQQTDLVGFMTELAAAFTRLSTRCSRQAAIAKRVLVLFDMDTPAASTESRVTLSDGWNQRLNRLNYLIIDFSSNLDAQEDALAFLEGIARLARHSEDPLTVLPAPASATKVTVPTIPTPATITIGHTV